MIIPNIWKVIKFHGSSHHQPDILFIDYTYYLGCTSKDGTMKMQGFLHQSAGQGSSDFLGENSLFLG